MRVSARIQNAAGHLQTSVQTDGADKLVPLPPKPEGTGSAINGGELLALALATCFCNDLYREAAKLNLTLDSVTVECTADFFGPGEPGANFRYHVSVAADVPAADIQALIQRTDQVAEIHNTLRRGVAVTLG